MRCSQRTMVCTIMLGTAVSGIAFNHASAAGTNPTEAQVNQQVETRPDLGSPVDPALTVGEGGYKVFEAGSIVQIAAVPVVVPLPVPVPTPPGDAPIGATTYYRRANSDAYISYGGAFGNHSSDSDFEEDTVKAEGTIQREGKPIGASCYDAQYGRHSARCSENMNAPDRGTYRANGYHYYHENGYTDNDLYTADTVVR